MATTPQATRAAEAVANGATGDPVRRGPDVSQLGAGELVRHLSEETSRLVRDELRLAELETRSWARAAGLGAGVMGFGGPTSRR